MVLSRSWTVRLVALPSSRWTDRRSFRRRRPQRCSSNPRRRGWHVDKKHKDTKGQRFYHGKKGDERHKCRHEALRQVKNTQRKTPACMVRLKGTPISSAARCGCLWERGHPYRTGRKALRLCVRYKTLWTLFKAALLLFVSSVSGKRKSLIL